MICETVAFGIKFRLHDYYCEYYSMDFPDNNVMDFPDNNVGDLPSDSGPSSVMPDLSKDEIKELSTKILEINAQIKNLNKEISPIKSQISILNKEKYKITSVLRPEMSKKPLVGYNVTSPEFGMSGIATVKKQVRNVNQISLFIPELDEWLHTLSNETNTLTSDQCNTILEHFRNMALEKSKGKYNFCMTLKPINQM